MLTGDKNIDRIIFLKLSNKDLRNVFQLNSQFRKVSEDETFWMQKYLKLFAFKVEKECDTWKESYIRFQLLFSSLNSVLFKTKFTKKHNVYKLGSLNQKILNERIYERTYQRIHVRKTKLI